MDKEIAIKKDEGKLRMDLIPVHALEEVAHSFTYGVTKYGEVNWQRGLKFSRIFAAAMRHCWKWWRGEKVDQEDGIHHLAHAIADLMMLLNYDLLSTQYKDFDDRADLVAGFNFGACNIAKEKTMLDIVKERSGVHEDYILKNWCPAGTGKDYAKEYNMINTCSHPNAGRHYDCYYEGACKKCWEVVPTLKDTPVEIVQPEAAFKKDDIIKKACEVLDLAEMGGIASVKDKEKDITYIDVVARILHKNRQDIIHDTCPGMYSVYHAPAVGVKAIFTKDIETPNFCPLQHASREFNLEEVAKLCEECWSRTFKKA